MLNKMKKILCNVLAVTGLAVCAGTFGACETNEPKVKMEVSFNGTTYTLNYNLYRKLTPTTVKHFLSLVEHQYYDGLCVHDYSDTALYTGVYEYKDEALEYRNYTEMVKDYIPQSVWKDSGKTAPTYTLYGEMEANNFTVSNGALQERYGSLVMVYSDTASDVDAYVERNDGGGIARRDYTENSATSQFYISLGTTVKYNKNYCVFARLDDDSTDDLAALVAAIGAYIEENCEAAEDFISVKYGELIDIIDGEREKAYDVPVEPIKIEKMTVTRY